MSALPESALTAPAGDATFALGLAAASCPPNGSFRQIRTFSMFREMTSYHWSTAYRKLPSPAHCPRARPTEVPSTPRRPYQAPCLTSRILPGGAAFAERPAPLRSPVPRGSVADRGSFSVEALIEVAYADPFQASLTRPPCAAPRRDNARHPPH